MSHATTSSKKIWAMVILFILPAFLAVTVFMLKDYLNITSKSEGLLIMPPLSLKKLQLTTMNNEPVEASTFADHWWLIYLTPTTCTEECGTQNAKLRSVYLALTKNMPRVKRIMLAQENALTTKQLQQASIDKPVLIEKIKNPDYLLSRCSVATGEGLFIMDPLGNIMLCYAPKQEAHAILQDLEKLLKASKIG